LWGEAVAEFKIMGINHLGLAAKDPVRCAWFLQEALGLKDLGQELVTSQKTMTQMFLGSNSATEGDQGFLSRLEILSPQEGTSDGPISKFIEKKSGGIHHVAIAIQGLDDALTSLRQKGVRLIDEAPRPGAHNTRIAFIHPESTGGILFELVEQQLSP
jgi:methylmalonyl-CoA/ethylmalonyl-CoA epimerase